LAIDSEEAISFEYQQYEAKKEVAEVKSGDDGLNQVMCRLASAPC